MSNTSSESEKNVSICANCGKGEEASTNLRACAACNLVKYCSRDCQIAHRPQHKKACKKRAKELHDKKLFKQPPPEEDCPICFQRLPSLDSGTVYMNCCGKEICRGCVYAFQSRATKKEHDICPFCRTPPAGTDEEAFKRYEKRMDLNDGIVFCKIGCYHYEGGQPSFPQDQVKAVELWHRAAELGNANASYNLGTVYKNGRGAERNCKKSVYHYELAAMRGSGLARQNLGVIEAQEGNPDRALNHWMIAVRDGDSQSLENIKRMYGYGYATKDDYEKALHSYQAYVDGGSSSLVSIKRLYETDRATKDVYDKALQYYLAYLDEIKSDQRDEAAAADGVKYYESAV